MRRSRPSTLTHVEALEPRQLLAGNVSVAADASLNARIIGDSRANAIDVTLSAGAGYLVTGRRGTRVNGFPSVFIRTRRAVHFDVALGKGSDSVSFVGTFNTQNLSIDTGAGDDRVIVSGTTHVGDLSIFTGKGRDSVTLSGVRVTRNLTVDTGEDDDILTIARDSSVEGSASLNAGRGNNQLIGVTRLRVTGAMSISGIASREEKDEHEDGENDDNENEHGGSGESEREHDD